jgi:hypothetical protein
MARVYLIVLLHLLIAGVSSGQGPDEESNWYKEIGRGDDPYSGFDYRKYTKDDIAKAKSKYLQIASERSNDDWAGSYSTSSMLGRAEIIWDKNNGFVYHFVYHTLASIDYGKVVTRGDSVWFASERFGTKDLKRSYEAEHIRVKLGQRHLLVPENRLKDFAILVAGLEVPHGRRKKEIEHEESFFWEKVEDEDKEVADVPTYPSRYAHLVQNPVRSQVLAVGKLRVKRKNSTMWATTSEDHMRSLTLSRGQRHGVKVGMRFWLDDLQEWVEVVSVRANRSVAELLRPFIKGKEYCDSYDKGKVTQFPCRDPGVGMQARTKTDYF